MGCVDFSGTPFAIQPLNAQGRKYCGGHINELFHYSLKMCRVFEGRTLSPLVRRNC